MTNAEISAALHNIARFLVLTGGDRERRRAFSNAADLVAGIEEALAADDDAVEALFDFIEDEPADQVECLIDDGTSPLLETFCAKFPVSLLELLDVKGLGPSMARRLHDHQIDSLDALIDAGDRGILLDIKGIGAKTAARLLEEARARRQTIDAEDVASKAEVATIDAPAEVVTVDAPAEVVTVDAPAEVVNVDATETPDDASSETAVAGALDEETPVVVAPEETADVEIVAQADDSAEEAVAEVEVNTTASPKPAEHVDRVAAPKPAEHVDRVAARPELPSKSARRVSTVVSAAHVPGGVKSPLRCTACHAKDLIIGPNFGFCASCQQVFGRADGILDLIDEATTPTTLAQRLMEFAPYSKIYEALARPLLTITAAGRPVQREVEQALELLDLDGLEAPRPLAILDVACGTGHFTRAIAQALALSRDSHVYGLDLSLPMLQRARSYALDARLDNITWVRGDGLALPFASESLDRLHCAGAFHLMPRHEQVLAEFERVLKPGGRMVLSTFAERGPLRLGARLAGVRLLDPERLFALVDEAGFEVEETPTRWSAISIQAHKRPA